jgi:hypothetical protein
MRAFYYTPIVLSLILASGCSETGEQNPSDDSGVDTQTSDSGDGGTNQNKGRVLATCGNNKIDPGELCDGTDLGGATCQTGTLLCSADCKLIDNSRCRDIVEAGRPDTGVFVRDAGIIEFDDSGMDDTRTLVTGVCARSSGSSCQSDLDCTIGGCGKELCYNPTYGNISTTCDCVAPSHLSCGCVNGKCGWWQ